MSVLGAVSYELNADARPLAAASKEAIKAFEGIDEAARKANTSILGIEKSHSLLGKTIRGTVIGGAATGIGLFAKHLLEGTKAGESLNGVLGKLGGHLRSFRDTMAEGLRPLRAWLTNTEAGTKAVTTFEKGISKTKEGFQKLDEATSKGAKSVKSWAEEKKKATGTEVSFSKAMEEGRGAVTKAGIGISELGKRFQVWNQTAAQGTGVSAKFAQGLSGLGRGATTFGKGVKEVGSFVDELGEGITKVELGALGLTGKLGKTAVTATHFSEILGLGGMALSVFGGNLGLVGGVLATAASGVTGLTALLGGLIEAAGFAAEALGERLLASVEVWIERFAEAEVTILGFNRAIQAYNTTVKDTPITTSDLEKSMSALGKATGTATVDIRQATLRALELSKVTGLTSDQVNQLVERSIDLSSALHRDLWDAVWAVLDAMRGFPLMATGFGLALDEETLKTSEFSKALGGTYDSLNELQKSQVIFQEMMHQSSFAAGIAAEQLETTLVGAARKSEQAFNSFHLELGKGAATVWQPYSSTMAVVIGTLNLIPQPLVHAVGAFTAFSGVALKVIGRFLELTGVLVTFNVAIFALTKGIPLLGTGLAWLLTKVTGTTVAFIGWGQILGKLASATLLGFGSIVAGVAKQIKDLGSLLLTFSRAHPAILAITAIAGAFLLLKKAIDSQKKSLEENLKIYDKGIEKEKERIKSLENIEEALKSTTLSEKEFRDIVLKAKDDYPALLKFLNKENISREEILVTLNKIIQVRKEEEKYLKSKATTEVGKELGFYRGELDKTRKSTAGLTTMYVVYQKEMDKLLSSHKGFGLEADILRRRLERISEGIAKNTEQEAKLAEQEAKLTREWERRHGVVKGVEQALIKTATIQQHLITAGVAGAEDFKESLQAIGDDISQFEEYRSAAYRGRTELIQKSLEFEREQFDATQEALRKDMDETFEYEQYVRKGRERELSAFNASIVAGATTASKGAVDSFMLESQEYFSFLDRLQRENLDAQHAASTAFSDTAKKTRAFVVESLSSFSDQMAAAMQGAAESQGGLAEDAERLVAGLSRSYGGFSSLVQEAYAKIAGPQKNYLSTLVEAGSATKDLSGITLSSVVQIEESYDRAVRAIQKADAEINEFGKTELDLAAQQKKLKELNLQRLKEIGEAWGRYYASLKERQGQMLSSYREALQELRGLEEDRLRRGQAMEQILRDLREKAGEINITAQEKFYARLKDQDTRLLEAQKLGARERIKVTEDVIQALSGMVGEVQEASGKIALTEKQVAQIVLDKVKKAWESTKIAEKEAAAETTKNLDDRKKDLQEVQDQLGVAQAGMAAFREAHKQAVTGMLEDEGNQLNTFAQKAANIFNNIDLQLQSLARERKIDITLDEDYFASMERRLKLFKEILDSIASGQPVTLRGPNLPTPPPKPPTVAPAPPTPAPAPRSIAPGYATQTGEYAGTPSRLSRWLFPPEEILEERRTQGKQQGGQVTGRIPGFGGGDKVRIQALPGQFVVRKEAVSRVGSGLLAALSQAPDGRLGGFQPQRSVPVAVEPGEFVVPREAVAARGVGFFNRINRMQEGGPVSEASAFRWQAIGQAFGAALNPPMDDQTRVESALELAKLHAGIFGVGQANRLRQIEEFDRRFRASGNFITREEYDMLSEGLAAEMNSLEQMQRSGYMMRTNPTAYLSAQRILKRWVSAEPTGISAGVEAPEGQEEFVSQDRFQRGRRPSRPDIFGAVDRGDLTAQGILGDPGLSPRFAARLLGRAGFGTGEILGLRKQRQIEMTTQALGEGKLSPARALGQLMGIGKTESGVGGMMPAATLSLLLERGLLHPETLVSWVRAGRVATAGTLLSMLRSGTMTPESFASTLLTAGKSREEVSRMLRSSRRPVDEGLLTLLESNISLTKITSALEGKGDLGALIATAQALEFAPATNYDYQGRRRGPQQTIDLKFLEKARSALGLQTGGVIPSMEGFDMPPPPAFSRSSGGGGRASSFSSSDMKRSASDIESAFSEMFSNLERRAGTSASRIGQTLFESLYSTLKDRLIRESNMG